MVNPNKYIRIAYISAFTALSVPSWSKKIPLDVAIPDAYVLLTSQTKNVTERDKDGFEWLCTIVFDINNRIDKGFSDTDLVDDIEQEIINIVESDVTIAGFTAKNISLINSIDLDVEVEDVSIMRRVLTYQFWLSNID